MSRSYKKKAIASWCNSKRGNQKKYTSKTWRALRRRISVILSKCIDSVLPSDKEFYNEWSSPRDGKLLITNKKDEEYKTLLRK